MSDVLNLEFPNPKLLHVYFFYVDQLYAVPEAQVTCFSTFFISTVSCVLVLSRGAITNRWSSNIEYLIKI